MDTSFPMAIGPMASEAGAPPVCSLRTIKSDVVVGIPSGVGEKLDEEEAGWKISGKYVSFPVGASLDRTVADEHRPLSFFRLVDRERLLSSPKLPMDYGAFDLGSNEFWMSID